jgi:uncharacterized protein YkwD
MKSTFFFLMTLLAATACTPKPIPFPEEAPDYYSLTLFDRINRYRMTCGLDALQWDSGLARLARDHSINMLRREKSSHRGFDKRHQQAGSRICIENVGWNYPSPLHMFEGWRRSEGHNQNLLNDRVNRVGIAEVGRYVTYFACM